MATLFFDPRQRALDDNGAPISGAKLYFYEAGTTTPLDVYSDNALSSAISQPVVADSSGWFEQIYMAADDYKAVLKTSADVTIWTQDDYTPGAAGSTNLINGIGTQAAARTALDAASATDVSSNTTALASIQGQLTGIGGTLGAVAALASVAVANLASGFGEVCLARYRYTNSGTGSLGTIPNDGTIPQITEGGQVWSESVTPNTATSKLVIRGVVNLNMGGNYLGCVAIHINGAVSASRTFAGHDQPGAMSIPFEYEYEPGSTSAVTVEVRAGPSTGSGTLNNQSSHGTSSVSTMTIEEWETV